jgi:hypothetical protein
MDIFIICWGLDLELVSFCCAILEVEDEREERSSAEPPASETRHFKVRPKQPRITGRSDPDPDDSLWSSLHFVLSCCRHGRRGCDMSLSEEAG